MRAPRLLVLACSGADPRWLLERLPQLPTLDGLCRGGSCGLIDGPPRAADVWTTWYTGLPPEAHSAQAVARLRAGDPEQRRDGGRFLWDWLNRWGLTTGFLEPPHAWPAPRVQGFFVARAPDPSRGGAAISFYPPELAEVAGREGAGDPPAPSEDPPDRMGAWLQARVDLALRLQERAGVDVLWVSLPGPAAAGRPPVSEQPPERVARAYRELDRACGRLIDRLRPETVLALVEGPEGELRRSAPSAEGFYAVRGPGVYRGVRYDIHFHDGFRLIARAAGLPAPPGTAGRTPPVFNEFSQRRAAEYDQQQWAANPDYLSAFLAFADLRPEHHVLEAGVGTGQVAAAGAPRVARYVGLDNSEEMLAQARRKLPGLELLQADLRSVPLPDGAFDRVLARSVLHHVTHGLEQVMRELYRVLRPGGRLVIGEGIPPSPESVAHFTEVFALKEERLVLLPQHLVRLLEGTGFVDIRYQRHVMPQVSVRGWLERSDLSEALKARLLEMHRTTPPEVQRAYRTTMTPDDVLVDFTFALVSGTRPAW